MRQLRAALPGAIETIIAMVATVLLIAWIDPQPGFLVLGAVLAMTLSRSKLVDTWRGRLESVVVLPVLAIVTGAVALLLVNLPIVGAVAFTAAMFLSIWLRRFGPTWRRIGSLIALPFITLLIAPVHVGSGSAWQVALVSLLALVVVVAVRLLGGLVWHREVAPPEEPTPPGTLRPRASTRMAIQFAAAIAAAFALGFLLFPEHWGWVVLTAYLVNSGNRGRADVVYKSGLRIVGAVAGSLAAFAIAGVRLEGPALVAVVLGALAVGLLLRTISYAFWALVMTLALTILQGGLGTPTDDPWPRVLAIVVGAACGVLASWIILPIRSENVLRRRIANLLAAYDAALSEGTTLGTATAADPAPTDGTPGDVAAHPSLAPIDEVAPPFVALARVPFAPAKWRRSGQWIGMLRQLATREVTPSALPALRATRGTLREPERIGPALKELLATLD